MVCSCYLAVYIDQVGKKEGDANWIERRARQLPGTFSKPMGV